MALPQRITLLLAALASLSTLVGTAGTRPVENVAAAPPAPVVTPSSTPALALDAPDPDVVRDGSAFFAFTTGTTWGNQIAVAETTNADPATGWTALGSAFTENGDAAPPASWEVNNTPTSPGVIELGGQWIMFYDAEDSANGSYCLTVATASSVTGPYTDSSSGPLECQQSLGGSIDPQPFVDPKTGDTYLLWKSNTGASSAASEVWSAPLSANGLALAGTPTAIFTIASATYSWQTTTDDPSMVYAGGHYYLFFTGGDYESNDYPVGYVLCSNGPSGGCDQDEPGDPILNEYGGSGGGMEFTDATGHWWIAYQTWEPSRCTSYGSGCERQLFVVPISLPPLVPSITTTALPAAPLNTPYDQSLAATGGTPPYAWSITSGTLPTGLTLGATTGAITGTPTVVGTQSVTFEVTDADHQTASVTLTVTVVPPDPYSPLTPVRICDSREGNPSNLSGTAAQCNGIFDSGSRLPSGVPETIDVAGSFGVPSDATAVDLNITVVDPSAAGYLTVVPAGSSPPLTSNLNYAAGEVVPNLVEVGTGASGQVSIYSSAAADIVVDLEGYVAPIASGGSGAGLYDPLTTAARLCDTRSGNPSDLSGGDAQCDGKRLGAGATIPVRVASNNGVPAGATAAVLNVTVVNPSGSGYLTVFPAGAAQPYTANVNYTAGATTGNRVIVPLATSGADAGEISVFSSAAADVVVDVSGYYSAAGGTGGLFSAEPSPVRICDTRNGNPAGLSGLDIQCDNGTLGRAATDTIQVSGLAGIPAGATAAVVNLTAVTPTADTFLTVFPGAPRPVVSDLNPAAGEVKGNLTVATLSPNGTVSIYNDTGSVDVVVDVLGWYTLPST